MNVPLDVNMILMCAWFIVMALMGALAYIYFYSVTDKKLRERHLVLSVIAGFIYYILYSEHNFPNTIMCIVTGWFAPDFVEGIMKKYKEKKGGNKNRDVGDVP